jgi:hypothetical protein
MNKIDEKRLAALEARVKPAQPDGVDRQELDALIAEVLALPSDEKLFVAKLLAARLGPEYWVRP